MAIWEIFESECTDYLNKNFSEYAMFTHQGKSDSTVPDILVNNHDSNSFYMEVKYCPAQCGQFVLIPNISLRKFEYSRMNSSPMNIFSDIIINHMNNHFDSYKEAGTSGKDINFEDCKNVFASWIINSYEKSNVKFIITNDYVILPVVKFQDFFDVTAKYRVKRSGSSSVGKSRMKAIMDFIESLDYPISSIYEAKDKLYVTSSSNLHNKRFYFQKYEYMFSKGDNNYEVRRLSNTFNANVIFSITRKKTTGLSKIEYISEISKLL